VTVLSKPPAETNHWPDRVATQRVWQGGTPRIVVAHAIWLDDGEIALLAAMGSCPAVGSWTTGQVGVEEVAWSLTRNDVIRGFASECNCPAGIETPCRG